MSDLPFDCVLVANPGSRRVALFQQALTGLGLPAPRVVPWIDLLAGRTMLEEVVGPGWVVRIDSPGQDFAVEKALIAAGADVAGELGPPRVSAAEAERLTFDKGRILYPRQWFLGFRETLRRLGRQLDACPRHVLMSRPADIAVMFDKARCHDLFATRGIPVPAGVGRVGSYGELRARMRQAGCPRVFVKLAHGSSASGVVAYETNGPREQAHSTVELVRRDGELRLYNSRRIRRYDRHEDVVALLDALGREGVWVERWVPKAGLDGQTFDLRVVVIAGQARHVVVRLSRSPMTNLHLKNRRGDAAVLRERMGDEAWAAALASCERSAAVFPHSLHAGIDLAVTPSFRRHAVLEINAFGDLLPGVTHAGEDTYAAEVRALRGWLTSCRR